MTAGKLILSAILAAGALTVSAPPADAQYYGWGHGYRPHYRSHVGYRPIYRHRTYYAYRPYRYRPYGGYGYYRPYRYRSYGYRPYRYRPAYYGNPYGYYGNPYGYYGRPRVTISFGVGRYW
jgi:hypothetical protein